MVKQTHLCKNNFNQQKSNKKKEKKSNHRKERKKLNSNPVGHSNLFRCPLRVVGTLDMVLIFDH